MKKALLILIYVQTVFSNSVVYGQVPSFQASYSYSIENQLRYYAQKYGATEKVDSIRARRISDRFKESQKIKSGFTSGGSAVIENLGHQGQALMLILIMTGVELVRQEVYLSKLKQQEINYSDLEVLAWGAAEKILLGGMTYSSMIGAGTMGAIAYKPLKLINSFISDQKIRPIFKEFLKAGIVSFIAFVGWEMGAQLWSEAKELIENDSDYERAERLSPILLIPIKLFDSEVSNSKDFQEDFRVFNLIVGKVFQILLFDSELRNSWIYNSWRLKIATGGFASMVAAMVSAGVLGCALFPGAGTLGGICFGLIGAGATMILPEPVKNNITDKIASTRSYFGEKRAETMKLEIRDIYYRDNRPMFRLAESSLRDEPPTKYFFNRMRNYREDAATALYEIVYRSYTRFMVLRGNLTVARTAGNQKDSLDLEIKLKDAVIELKATLETVKSFYKIETESLFNIKPRPKSIALVEIDNEESKRLVSLQQKIDLLSIGLLNGSSAASSILLNKIYFLGFKEAYLRD